MTRNQKSGIKAYTLISMMVCVCLVGLISLLASISHANSAWGEHDWDPAPTPAWTSEYGWVVLDTPTTGGNTGGWLSVTFTNTAVGPDASWQDIIHTPATSLFAGTYSISNWFEFDFFASDVLPNALQVRWSSTTNSYIWGSVIDGPTTTGAWETLRSPTLFNWDNWDIEPFGTEEQFLSDLTDIEWVGLYIDRNTALEQIYGIDNFALMIPEPAQIIMLAFALIAVWWGYRRREQEAKAEV